MALMQCSECGNLVSDKADSCPKCGCPVEIITDEKQRTKNDNQQELDNPYSRAINQGVRDGNINVFPQRRVVTIAMILLIFLLVVCGVVFAVRKIESGNYEDGIQQLNRADYEKAQELFSKAGNYKDSKKYVQYCEGLLACEEGDYYTAYDKLIELDDFEDTKRILTEIYYETRLFEGLTSLRSKVKNADTTELHDVVIYEDMSKSSDAAKENPIFIVTISGQNGFGGYSSSYAIISQESGDSTYSTMGLVSSIEDGSFTYKTINTRNLNEMAGAVLIRLYLESGNEIKDVIDVGRVQRILNKGDYTKIKRIDELTYEYIASEAI